MADSEFIVQVFLLVATIFCYIVLVLFILYGLHYCCVQACFFKTKKNDEEDNAEVSTRAENHHHRWGKLKLLYPFQRDDKNAIIAPISHTSKNTPAKNFDTEDNKISDNIVNSNILDERNPFVDKKYYDIFMA